MDLALLVEKSLFVIHRKHPFMPDRRVDVEPLPAFKPKCLEILWLHIIAWQRQGHDERTGAQRKEQLPAIGMVIAMPEKHALARARLLRFRS